MDIEFHYYMTYLIAARAGFSPEDAKIIAHSAQSVDDNHICYAIDGASSGTYKNCISQTMDILKQVENLHEIYCVFHFIPGDQDAPTAARTDTLKHDLVTTPNSPIAKEMLRNALTTKDLYRIGIAAHSYVDTWAHQNFVGQKDEFNNMPDAPIEDLLMNVGHGVAKHQPDEPALVWTDARLVDSRVVNRGRFLDAAEHLFQYLAKYVNPSRSDDDIAAEGKLLRDDLKSDIGEEDPNSSMRDQRIARYLERAKQKNYRGCELENYDNYAWFNVAIKEDGADLHQDYVKKVGDIVSDYMDLFPLMSCNWSDPKTYQQTDWYKFVEAVKEHQSECWDILESEDLPSLKKSGFLNGFLSRLAA